MIILDAIRNFFIKGQDTHCQGCNDSWHQNDNFRNPIWQNDDDDDDDDDGDFRRFSNSVQFNIFSNPLEITRYFESQMEHMMKNFFYNFGENTVSTFEGSKTFDTMTQLNEKSESNLRDQFLKHDPFNVQNELSSRSEKVDFDLDGKISFEELKQIWKQSNSPFIHNPQNGFSACRKSISVIIKKGPDCFSEEQRTVKDCDGNITTTITKQTGDKIQKVTITRNKIGEETRHENLVEIDNNQPSISGSNWNSVFQPGFEPLNYFPWHKFFGPHPKL